MQTAVDRFLGKYPTARLGLAAFASIVVLVDLIVLVQVAGPTAVDSTVNVPAVTAPAGPAAGSATDQASAAPTAAPTAAPASAPAEATPVPPMLVPPRHTAAPAPAPAQTRARPVPSSTARSTRSALPEPTREGRGRRSPFEQRCRDGEIQPWLCHGMPN
jgi:hypothetical protein